MLTRNPSFLFLFLYFCSLEPFSPSIWFGAHLVFSFSFEDSFRQRVFTATGGLANCVYEQSYKDRADRGQQQRKAHG